MKMNEKRRRLAVQAAFTAALAAAACSLFAPFWAAATACLILIVAGVWIAAGLEKPEQRQANALAAIVAALSFVLLCGRFIAAAGITAIAVTCAGLLLLYAVFKRVVSKTRLEARVVSTGGGRTIVEVGGSLLQFVKPGLHDVEAKGLKKGSKVKVVAETTFFGKTRLKRVK